MTEPQIRPHYVTVSSGQIGLARAGSGPGLTVLASPMIGAAVTARRFAALLPGWSITALALPGTGGSAAAPVDDLDGIATALAEAIERLGLAGTTLVACDLAAAVLPALFARLGRPPLAFGVGLDAARARAAHGPALPPLAPTTDGTHLQALWSHLRDTHLLDPADPTQATPSGEPLPSPEELDTSFVAAAVRPEAYAALHRILTATLAADAALDGVTSLGVTADLVAVLPAPSGPEAPALLPTAPRPGREIWYDFVETARGRVHLRRAGAEGTPLLVLPTGGGSSEQFAPVVRGLAEGRTVFAIDYFGNGLSDRRDGAVEVADLAADAAAVVEALGFSAVDVWGSHTGALVGLELAVSRPDLVGRLVLEGPVFVAPDFRDDLLDNYFPTIEPDKWGLHLPLVWNWRRDMFLYWPWYRVSRDAVRRLGLPSPQDLHCYAIGILESGPTYDRAYRSAFRYDTRARMPRLCRPALVCAGPNDMLINGLAETEKLAVAGVEVATTPTTVWWPAPPADAAAATLAIYDAFLKG
jgi:pimeloyl-ACP methyl ester carboxylesterase